MPKQANMQLIYISAWAFQKAKKEYVQDLNYTGFEQITYQLSIHTNRTLG